MEKESTKNTVFDWLLKGDPSIIYQTYRDLLDAKTSEIKDLQQQISKKGWGFQFLSKRDNQTGMWANGLYSPKWISTTYTLLDLKNLGIDPELKEYKESSLILLNGLWKIPEKKGERFLDLCICGMILNICCYAKIQSEKIDQIVDYILEKKFADGGFNCRWEYDKNHSSLHTTINILEGLKEYIFNGYQYRKDEIVKSIELSCEFILKHKLYKSDKTDQIIDKKMILLSWPSRWHYDILRGLDFFQSIQFPYDIRMKEAIILILSKKTKDNLWKTQQKYPGLVHFDMEPVGQVGRINTLRVLRVLKKYDKEDYFNISKLNS